MCLYVVFTVKGMWRLMEFINHVAAVMLICFSTLLYYTERDNPDEEIREYYGSVMRAIWAELINLHGEWILADFSAHGKAICTFIDLTVTSLRMVAATFSGAVWYADQQLLCSALVPMEVADLDRLNHDGPYIAIYRPNNTITVMESR